MYPSLIILNSYLRVIFKWKLTRTNRQTNKPMCRKGSKTAPSKSKKKVGSRDIFSICYGNVLALLGSLNYMFCSCCSSHDKGGTKSSLV